MLWPEHQQEKCKFLLELLKNFSVIKLDVESKRLWVGPSTLLLSLIAKRYTPGVMLNQVKLAANSKPDTRTNSPSKSRRLTLKMLKMYSVEGSIRSMSMTQIRYLPGAWIITDNLVLATKIRLQMHKELDIWILMKVIMSFRWQEVNIIRLLCWNQDVYTALVAMMKDRLELVIFSVIIKDKRP